MSQAQLAAGIMPHGMSDLRARQAIAMLHGLIQAELDGLINPHDISNKALTQLISRSMGIHHTPDRAMRAH